MDITLNSGYKRYELPNYLKIKKILKAKNKYFETIQHQINRSAVIQKTLLPDLEDVELFVKDGFLLYRPMSNVSGDFYWVTQSEDKLNIVLGDSTGHGLPGAFLSMMAFTTLYGLNAKGKLSPSEINSKLTNMLHNTFERYPDSDKLYDGFDLASVCIDKKKKIISYSGAKRPMLMVKNGELIEIKGDRNSACVLTSQGHEFLEYQFRYEGDESFYIFSDGYQDQFGGDAFKRFTYRRFREHIMEAQKYKLSKQKRYFENALNQWKKSNPNTDDICLIGFQLK